MDDPVDAVISAFRGLLPPATAVAAAAVTTATDDLHPDEVAAAAGMAAGRRAEFAAGRRAARRALLVLGAPPVAIAVGPGRAPAFPPGLSGSITHAGGLAAAAVRRGTAPLGIDLEVADEVPAEVRYRVCSGTEEAIGPATLAGGVWARVVFSAKESVYKCVARDAGRFIDFDEIRVVAVAGNRVDVAAVAPDLLRVTKGLEVGFELRAGLVLTAAWR